MPLPERYFFLVLKDASSIEEVDEESAVSEGAPPLVPPREDVGVGESGEEFQVGIREGKDSFGPNLWRLTCRCQPWGIKSINSEGAVPSVVGRNSVDTMLKTCATAALYLVWGL